MTSDPRVEIATKQGEHIRFRAWSHSQTPAARHRLRGRKHRSLRRQH